MLGGETEGLKTMLLFAIDGKETFHGLGMIATITHLRDVIQLQTANLYLERHDA